MNPYRKAYERATGRAVPAVAVPLDNLFAKMATGDLLPPRGQQAVDAGLTAHSLNDPQENPAVYDYYHWVMTTYFAEAPVNELSAKLIGMAFTSLNIFQTDLPQPLTLNPWQATAMADYPLRTQRAVVIENNGVFIWLAHLHPDWPLINQGGNDFNAVYVTLIQHLETRGVQLTYLGDLDSKGIQMADHLFCQLRSTPIVTFSALQSPANVTKWLAVKGKRGTQRTRPLTVKTPVFQRELDAVNLAGRFVEQEQLISEYERLIDDWVQGDK
ncbi:MULTISPECIES: DUF2399 domain-containing protein [Lactobacillaceae]|uniref:DUF2399 domain-containing protein n=1 Tax=Lactobacillaceae TaxID=33958 RepID=UPI00145696D1|nr:DUF2399 domain-containing protein [Lactobacillus sp. HBUAS51381]NLR10309.1 DUF2399 domain-containing protein [Lactobacillus sp. HBUAS51381]